MTEIAIRVENLSKRYRIGFQEEVHDTLVGAVIGLARQPLENLRRLRQLSRFDEDDTEDTIWALKDVSFEVKRGEVVGVIGRNGAGKSTLLKILSRITYPTSGRVELQGRVSSLLEVGTGFHPELTGRENVYLNGTILGMRKIEIDQKFDEILEFSGVEKFIDTPVKRYSSGMRVRLAFSVAAHLEPEILLVDEVLAVGDVAFQKKCLDKMEDVSKVGRTVLFVSHNMAAIQALCPKSVLLHSGILSTIGSTSLVIDKYLTMTSSLVEASLDARIDRQGNGSFRFTSVQFVDEQGQPVDSVSTGQTVRVCLGYKSQRETEWSSCQVSIGFRDRLGRFLFNCPSRMIPTPKGKLGSQGHLICTIPRFPLPEGEYQFNLFSAVHQDVADWIKEAGILRVNAGDYYGTGKLPPDTHNGVLVDFEWRSVRH